MSAGLVLPIISVRAIAPILVVAATACLLLLLDLLPPRDRKDHLGVIGLAGVVLATILSLGLWGSDERAFNGMVRPS